MDWRKKYKISHLISQSNLSVIKPQIAIDVGRKEVQYCITLLLWLCIFMTYVLVSRREGLILEFAVGLCLLGEDYDFILSVETTIGMLKRALYGHSISIYKPKRTCHFALL